MGSNRGGIGFAPVIMALGGGLLAGLGIHEYYTNGDIGLAGILEIACGILLFLWGALFLLGKGRTAVKLGFRMARVSVAAILLLLIVIGLAGYAVWKGGLSVSDFGFKKSETPVASEKVPLQLPIKFIIRNKLTGTPLNVTTAELYNSKGFVVETLVVSSGTATTSGAYKSGESYYLKIVDGGVFYFKRVILPLYDAKLAEIKPPDYHIVTIDGVDVPSSLGVKVINSLGEQVTSVNLTATEPFTILVTNSVADTTLPDPFYNPLTRTQYGNYLVIEVTGSGSTLPRIGGATSVFHTQGKDVYVITLAGLDCKTDPRTGSATPASKSFGITIDPTGAPSGSYTVKITAYTDLDLSYIKDYGVVNNDAVSLGSVTLTVNV